MLFGSKLMSNLHATLAAAAGVTVTYRRGAATVALSAVRGRSDDQDYGDDEGSVTAREWSFILKASDLVLGGVAVLPELGDEIDVTESGATTTYVVANRTGERCFRYSDQFKLLIRVYAVET